MMTHAKAIRGRHDGGNATAVLHCLTDILHKRGRLRPSSSGSDGHTFAEKNRLFSKAALAVISCMLHGRTEVHYSDVLLDAEAADGHAILIREHLANDPEFQKMWDETCCKDILTILAQRILQG